MDELQNNPERKDSFRGYQQGYLKGELIVQITRGNGAVTGLLIRERWKQ
jgi:hypothetical protein